MKFSIRVALILLICVFESPTSSPLSTASVRTHHGSLRLMSAFYFWGANGHRIVGQIAENHLSEKAAVAVADLIGPEGLAQVSTWADEIRSDPNWRHAAPWHYITVEDDETYGKLPETPKNEDGIENIVDALLYFESVLRSPEAEHLKKAEALKFLVHFVGDIHQPLHVGRSDDRGGNSIEVSWFWQPSNLHRVWDSGIIEQQNLSFSEYVRFIDHAKDQQIAEWQKATYLDWVHESFELRSTVYDFGQQEGDEIKLSYGYVFKANPIVKQRLGQSGVRLAGVLNAVFGEK